MLNSHLWLVATVSDTTELENISVIIGRSTEGHSLENYTPPTFLSFSFFSWPHSLQDLIFLTRDWTHGHGSERAKS